MPSRSHNAICLVADGLHAGYLGAYGNTWLGTHNWDRLASEAALFDFAFVDTPDLTRLYRSYWTGVHAGCGEFVPGGLSPSLADRLESAGIETVLVTDDDVVAQHHLARGFGDTLHVEREQAHLPTEPAESIEETALASFFAQVLARLEVLSGPFMLWIHCGSLGQVWDAPRTLRQALGEEEIDDEYRPTEFDALMQTTPPCRKLPVDFNPDELFAVRRAYAAQVQVLDVCLGALTRSLADSDLAGGTLVAATGARGFPLGEHRNLGWCDCDLHDELIHVPWIIRLPDPSGASSRLPALVQPADLAMTLAAWFDLPCEPIDGSLALGRDLVPLIHGEAEDRRDRILIVGNDESRALRTPAWFLRKRVTSSIPPRHVDLFAKPDDRWEINEVHDRCPAIAAELEERLDELVEGQGLCRAGDPTPLSDAALHGAG